jgi:hypothetical protein
MMALLRLLVILAISLSGIAPALAQKSNPPTALPSARDIRQQQQLQEMRERSKQRAEQKGQRQNSLGGAKLPPQGGRTLTRPPGNAPLRR